MAEDKWLLDFKEVQIARHEHILFEEVNFRVAAGEFVYLTGPVGSGKSTLLKTISAEVPLTQGSAHVLGFDLTHIKSKDLPKLRRRLGIVFQNFQLLPDLTVQDNLDIVLRAFGVTRSSERSSRIEEALRDVGLETKSYKYPHELSGGEQQRVAIARALIGQPELILADEPTGNLDAENGLAIAELLHRLTKERGTAVIMATHNRLVLERYPARCVEMAEL
ncbi:putative cell division ATP-binding protein FtsE [Porphyromonas sp. oral taxon 278 str. W7784]|uniref:cell division ATP-binding protein FtsE n=1 Tax=Porphyromonas sp. oral taxon 278 TaxID=712437 RepID=UPI0003AD314E|nr:ABC transporter ATP-binding protein [Porphyromonas sp. oral taxon 278]ERJ72960.1 putative cell division ATP-binding protein FtsE [Porphyromonas sp. oral taxon 278 str. W7784]